MSDESGREFSWVALSLSYGRSLTALHVIRMLETLLPVLVVRIRSLSFIERKFASHVLIVSTISNR